MTSTVAPARSPAELPGLTSVRFFAALGVVLFHLGFAFDVYGRSPGLGDLLVPGPSAVSFFFVLSGFVLMWSCSTQATVTFWRARAARLVPLHLVMFVLGLLFAAAIGRALQAQWGLEAVLLQAWTPTLPAFRAQTSPIPASWSLSCELFFYASAPLLFARLPSLHAAARRTLLVVLGLITLAAAAASTAGLIRYVHVYQLPLLRLPEFAIGALLALEVRSGRLPRVPLLSGILLAGIGWLLVPHVPPAYAVAACTLPGWTLVIVSIAQRDADGMSSRLHHPALEALGRWSFALYLTHGLLLRVSARVLRRAFDIDMVTSGAATTAIVGGGMFLLFVAGAGAAHVLVERPLNRWCRYGRAGSRPAIIPVAASPATTGQLRP